MVAAAYAALTFVSLPFAYGWLQFRPSEALSILPYFFGFSVPGLYAGCVLANMLSSFGWIDMVFGGLATLLSAVWARKIKNPWLVPFPAVIINAVVVGAVITYLQVGEGGIFAAYCMNFTGIFISQTVSCYGLGLPFLFVMRKNLKHN